MMNYWNTEMKNVGTSSMNYYNIKIKYVEYFILSIGTCNTFLIHSLGNFTHEIMEHRKVKCGKFNFI